MTNHKEWFVNMKPAQDTVIIGDGKKLPAEGVGDILVQCFDGRKWVDRRLTGVRFVPALEANLLSFGAVTAKGMSVMLSSAGAKIINEGQVILIGRQERGIFHMRMRTTAGKGMSASAGRKDLEIWHQRLGHPTGTEDPVHVEAWCGVWTGRRSAGSLSGFLSGLRIRSADREATSSDQAKEVWHW